jgi:hypothetical protein
MKLRSILASIGAVAFAMFAVNGHAQAPAGSTGECKDGSYTTAAAKRGACAAHGGIKDWYGTRNAAATAAPAAGSSATPSPSAKSKATAPTANTASTAKSAEMPAATAAPGGGAGKVWVNTSSKVYHCQDDKWYGKTKKGEYMTETAAKTAGNHADHGKACS